MAGERSSPAAVWSFRPQVTIKAEERAAGREIERGRQALGARELSPERAAQRHRAEIDREEDRKPPSAHPFGQRHLRRDEQRRHHDDPGRAGEEARRHRQDRLARGAVHHQRGDRAEGRQAPPGDRARAAPSAS